MPSIFVWRACRLGRLLQPNPSEAGLLQRLQAGRIVPEEGATLLVDYGRPHEGITKHHAGHAVYTQKKWLLFHAEEVARQFYHRTVSSRQTVQMADSLSIGKPGAGSLD